MPLPPTDNDGGATPRETLTAGPDLRRIRAEVFAGLAARPKQLPSKLFYDERGSRLFERICALDEYYPTRTELAIMQQQAPAIARRLGPGALLFELGSGSSVKTRLLLDALDRPAAYVPIDISAEHLQRVADELDADYPDLVVLPLAADFTATLQLPDPGVPVARRVSYSPGSTIGNLTPENARAFLRSVRELTGDTGAFLIGVDLHKETAVLERAYNDTEGVTAEFNRNILRHVNALFDGDFDPDRFAHLAFYNEDARRIEMHLVSDSAQEVGIGGRTIVFEEGERLLTEYSHKYTRVAFAELAAASGWSVDEVWVDERRLFSVQYLVAA